MALPNGTVTFLFTDIEGSTKLAQEHPEGMKVSFARHNEILRSAIVSNGGYVFQVIGDSFCAAFHQPGDALKAAVHAQTNLNSSSWGEAVIKVRMGIHTGEAEVLENGEYQGYITLSRVQRLMSAGHGGQVLISLATEELVRDELPDGVSLLDLGERRLKDLIRSEHIYQLVISNLPIDFPPLKTLDVFRHNLPAQTTSFIGREKEMAEIKQALGRYRLVTLTGSGGTGKTRLSLQVAAELVEQYPDGVWLIELAPLTDPALIPQAMLSVLGGGEQQGKDTLQSLVDYVHDKKMLFILDNCEHLIEACAKVADALLGESQRLKILASSREALGIRGEMAWHVPSLSMPDIKQLPTFELLLQYEAVRLFIERAVLAQPHFMATKDNVPAITQICFRLDGIPLAIELASARVKILKVEQIAERLNDRFRLLTGGARTALPRQQTLRALIDWSYDLLSGNEQMLLRRLSVFAGGWTLELAEQVCSDEKIDQYEILDMLGRLVDKSLVAVVEGSAETRYRILETVRQYAREKLFESGEGEKIRDRHVKAFIKLAEIAEPEIRGANQLVWLDHLDMETDNLRAALEWSRERDHESFLQLATALWRFWSVRGYIDDLGWLPKALAATDRMQTALRACALARAGFVAWNHGDPQGAKHWSGEAEILSRILNEKASLALALEIQGEVEKDHEKKMSILEQALQLAREIGDPWLPGGILYACADSFFDRNDLKSARSFYEQGLKEACNSGDKRRICYGTGSLGGIALAQGEAEEAEKWYRETLAAAQEIKDSSHFFGSYWNITVVKIYLEDYAGAREWNAESFRIARTSKDLASLAFLNSGFIELAEGRISEAARQFEEGFQLAKQVKNQFTIASLILWLGESLRRKGDFVEAKIKYGELLAVYQAENLSDGYCCAYVESMGMMAIDQGQAQRGARLLGAREKLRASKFLMDFLPFMVRERDAHITTACEQLGEDAFHKAWEEGRSMTRDQAIELALE